MQEPHVAGTFEVLVDEEQLDVMWDASRSTMSILLRYPGRVGALPVKSAISKKQSLRTSNRHQFRLFLTHIVSLQVLRLRDRPSARNRPEPCWKGSIGSHPCTGSCGFRVRWGVGGTFDRRNK